MNITVHAMKTSIHLCPLITLSNQEQTIQCVQEDVLYKTPLSVTPGGSPDVNGCVASQTPEDFTTHLEMHPLKHTTILITLLGNQDLIVGSLQEEALKKTPLGVTCIYHGATCLNPILRRC
jgi:hypothetical protein